MAARRALRVERQKRAYELKVIPQTVAAWLSPPERIG